MSATETDWGTAHFFDATFPKDCFRNPYEERGILIIILSSAFLALFIVESTASFVLARRKARRIAQEAYAAVQNDSFVLESEDDRAAVAGTYQAQEGIKLVAAEDIMRALRHGGR